MKNLYQKIIKYGKAFVEPNKLLINKKYIFIISHMRSRTTLLSHILGSNKNICGHRELHLPYSNIISKLKMRVALFNEENFEESEFLLDKLLHNRLRLKSRVFKNNDIKLLIVIREPMASLYSMGAMHQELKGNSKRYHLVEYYIKRLNYIRTFSEEYKGQYLFVDSDLLTTDTNSELEKITKYLNLKVPLTSEYKIFNDTGEEGKGDPSSNIQAGKIIKTKNGKPDFIDEQQETELVSLYENVREIVLKNSIY